MKKVSRQRHSTSNGASQFTFLVLAVVVGLMTLAFPVHGASGTEGASFLNIPVGARPASLGSAYTAAATDAYAPVWNPAGLGQLGGTELAGQHLSYLESIHYEFLSLVHPFSTTSGFGAAVQYLGSGDIAGTDINGNSIGNFSSYYAAYSLAYGRALTSRLSLGVTGKMITAKISDVSAKAFAGDVGALYRASDNLTLGFTMVNAGTRLKFLSAGDSLPLAFHAGLAYRPVAAWSVGLEGVYRKNGLASVHTGVEWKPFSALAFRAGYRTDTLKGLSPIAGLSLGAGINVWGHEFAYSWLPYGELGNTQYFSLVLRFGTSEPAKQQLIQFHHRRSEALADSAHAADPDEASLKQMLANDEGVPLVTPPHSTTSNAD